MLGTWGGATNGDQTMFDQTMLVIEETLWECNWGQENMSFLVTRWNLGVVDF